MKLKIQSFVLLFSIIISLSACNNYIEEDYMDWKVVSVSDAEDIQVAIRNRTANDFPNSSAIYVVANYREGDIVLKCTNHDISHISVDTNNTYTNPEMGFSLTLINRNTIKLHFEENASGAADLSDQITITNADGKTVCNTFLFIDRTFGEIAP